jgi:hypothetical protein
MGSPKTKPGPINALPLNGAWDEERCANCPWLEWNAELGRCNNRGEFICWLHLAEVFELPDS